MKLAIMQPYFFPYIGYFQLIAAVDLFVVYDNIKYTKKGWINRNRILRGGKDATFSLALKKDSDYLDIRDRHLAVDFNRQKLLNQLRDAYMHAPYFKQTFPLVEGIVQYKNTNLFCFLHHSISQICEHLDIKTNIKISSDIAIDHSLKNKEKVLALCKAVNARTYVNPIGGIDLYSKETFEHENIELKFIQTKYFEYPQFDEEFLPWLSIIDVLMFNSLDKIQSHILTNYELI
ncbi:WbqC family protein [Pollutimonas bauzanensis]|nr:WbqC family protein [Pollutimonas bauzanensis]